MVSIAFCKSNITNYFHCMLEETFKYSVSMLELVSHGTERQNGKAKKGNDGRGKKKSMITSTIIDMLVISWLYDCKRSLKVELVQNEK